MQNDSVIKNRKTKVFLLSIRKKYRNFEKKEFIFDSQHKDSDFVTQSALDRKMNEEEEKKRVEQK